MKYRLVLILIILLGCEKIDDMELAVLGTTSVSSSATTTEQQNVVLPSEEVSGIQLVEAKNGETYMMYVGLDRREKVLSLSYSEKVRGHDFYGGKGHTEQSLDYGATWINKTLTYDPDHLLADNGTDPFLSTAQIYDVMSETDVANYVTTPAGGDKTILTDFRDTRATYTWDKNFLIVTGFVAIGFNDNIDTVNNTATRVKVGNNRCMSIRIPVNGDGTLDIANKVVVIVEGTNSGFSGGTLALPNGDFLYCTYNSAPSAERYVKLFRSTDNGLTYAYEGNFFLDATNGGADREAATEIGLALVTIGGVNHIVASGRPTKQTEPFTNILAKATINHTTGAIGAWSYDDQNWAAWSAGTVGSSSADPTDNMGYILRSNGLSIIGMDDGTVIQFGRFLPALISIDYENFDYIDNSAVDLTTSGYGSMTNLGVDQNGDTLIGLAYYNVDDVQYVMLRYNPTTKAVEQV